MPTTAQHTKLMVIPLETPTLGDRSYLVHDGEVAFVIVPQRDIDRAVAAGAVVDRPMADQDYGGRGGSVRDPEGNHWSFGSYQPR